MVNPIFCHTTEEKGSLGFAKLVIDRLFIDVDGIEFHLFVADLVDPEGRVIENPIFCFVVKVDLVDFVVLIGFGDVLLRRSFYGKQFKFMFLGNEKARQHQSKQNQQKCRKPVDFFVSAFEFHF